MELDVIYNEDCLEGMKKYLSDQSVNCIVTSPPYNLGGDFHTMSNGKRVTYGDYKGFKDKMNEEYYQQWQVEVLNECYRVLKDDGFMFYNHKNRIVKGSIISPWEWIPKSKFNISQVIIMNLGGTPNTDKRRFFPVHELIFVLNKKPMLKLRNEEKLTDVWKVSKVSRRKSGHPAVFHEEVPRRCIEASTDEGDIVFDPFGGRGTTLWTAKKMKRRCIGFEISEEYHKLIENNLKTVESL